MSGTIKMVFSNAKLIQPLSSLQSQPQPKPQSQPIVKSQSTRTVQKSRFSMFDLNNIPKGCKTCGTA